MSPRVWPATALPLLLAGVVGCGGGDSTPPPPPAASEAPAALSKQELISQGDAICAEVNAAVGTVSSGSSSSTVQASQLAQLYGGMVDRLKSLGTPQEAAGYAEFISAAEALAQAESDARLAAERGEVAAIEEAESRSSSALSSFRSVSQSYGFEDCSEAPSAPTPGSAAAGAAEEAPSEGGEASQPEATPEPEPAPETGGAGSVEAGGGAEGGGSTGGGSTGGGSEGGGGSSSSGGIGPG